MNLRNTILIIASAAIILGPTSLMGAKAAGIELPDFATAEGATNLAGAVEEANVGEYLSIDGFLNAELQDAIETEVLANIPFKATAMLSYAATQRTLIASMANLYGYDVYPTYYGRKMLYISSARALTVTPQKNTDSYLHGYKAFCKALGDFSERHPDTHFYVVLPGGGDVPAVNPANELVSNPVYAAQIDNLMSEGLSGHDNISFVTDIGDYSGIDEYYESYFRTDHHWNIRGTYNAFNHLLNATGKKATSFGTWQEIPSCTYNGSRAREGLDLIGERVFDCSESFSDVMLVDENGDKTPGSDHGSFSVGPDGRAFDFYGKYYSEAPLYESSGEGTSLLLTDSYGRTIARPIAQLYEKTYRVQAMHHAAKNYSLEKLLSQYSPRDVIFVATPTNYKNLMDRIPDFFDTH